MRFDKLQKALCLFSFLVYSIAINVPKVYGENKGETLFKQICTACHTIGGGKLVGPDLKDIHQKRSEDWLVPWIRNSQEMVESGDADAIQIFEEYNKIPMPPNALSDDEIKAVLEYIKTESAPAEKAPEKKEIVGVPGLEEEQAEEDNTTFYVLLGLVVLFIILIYVLWGVRKSLRQVIAEKKGLSPPVELSIPQSIKVWMAGHKRWVALGVIVLLVIGSKAGWDGMMAIGVNQGYEPDQPIWFSHKIHAGENAINCVYCHSGAEKSKTAGIPSANVCMNCHKFIKEGSLTGTKEIAKIYAALDYDPETQIYGDNPLPIKWIRIHNLSDLSYFNHSQHVKVGKIECQTCHGPVEEMHVMRQESSLTMGWCIDCHRNTEVKMEGNPYYDEFHAKLIDKYKGEKITVDKIGGIECAKCHY